MRKKRRQQNTQPAKPPLLDAEDKRVLRKGQRLYDTKLKAMLEPAHVGMVAAIEVDSGDDFLGVDILEAVEKAEEKYPEKRFYIVKIGFPATVSFKHRMRL